MRWLFLVFVFLIAGGCEQAAEPDAIRLGLPAGVVTLDPRFATDAASHRVSRLLYARLVDFDAHDRPVPALAEWSQDFPLHYRFHLGESGRRFHDGSYLTAADVAATYESVLAPDSASPHRGALAMIERIETHGDDIIDFYLHQPDPLFPGRLTLGILPKEKIQAGHPFGRQPIGSGPLELLRWPSDDQLLLKRRDDGQVIELVTIRDPIVRVLKLLRAEVDLIQGDLPQELLAWLQTRDGVQVHTRPGAIFTYLGFNLEDPVVSDLRVRRAIAHAVDREAMIRHVLGNAARPAGSMLPPDHWAGEPSLGGYPYDPERARVLLAEAGYDDEHRPSIVYKTSNNPGRIRLATIIQHQLKQVGLDVEIRSYDWGTFYADIKDGRFQMFSLSWVGLKLPDIFRYVFHSESLPPAGANRGRFIDVHVDSLIETAQAQTDLDAQAALYRELQRYLHEQLPYVPLWYEDNVLAIRTGLADYPLPADGNYDGLITIRRQK